jgi:thioredoxin reductase
VTCCPVGRYADTTLLNTQGVGVTVDDRTGKIICVNEQTSVPNIYAIGMSVCVVGGGRGGGRVMMMTKVSD